MHQVIAKDIHDISYIMEIHFSFKYDMLYLMHLN